MLDGAVLLVSAVEGVQPQTRVLMRTLRRLRIPTLIFVDKIDRAGAQEARVLRADRGAARPRRAHGPVAGLGSRAAAFQPSRSRRRPRRRARRPRRRCSRPPSTTGRRSRSAGCAARWPRRPRGRSCTVFFGSAMTGAGVDALAGGVRELLPASPGESDGPVGGHRFRSSAAPPASRSPRAAVRGHGCACAIAGGSPDGAEPVVSAIGVFNRGAAVSRPSDSRRADRTVHGLGGVRIGDPIGASGRPPRAAFAADAETVVTPAARATAARCTPRSTGREQDR